MAFFRTYVSASIGSFGRWQLFNDVNMTQAQLFSVGGGYPGETGCVFGNVYQIVQNRSGGDLVIGDAVSLYFGAAARIGNLTAGSSTSLLVTDDTLDANLAGNKDWPGYVGVTAGVFATTAAEQRRQIFNNSVDAGASTIAITDPNAGDLVDGPVNGAVGNSPEVIATPGATYDYEVFCPFEVVKTDLDALITSIPQGTVCSTVITNGQFGVIQVGGICMSNVDGTTDLVAGDLLIPDAAAGVLSKWVVTTTDPTTAQVNQSAYLFGRILGAYTNNGVGLRMIQMLNRPLLPQTINW
jgi:hypothetical protein